MKKKIKINQHKRKNHLGKETNFEVFFFVFFFVFSCGVSVHRQSPHKDQPRKKMTQEHETSAIGMGRQKFQNDFLFSLLSRNSTTSACYKSNCSSTPFPFELWWSWVWLFSPGRAGRHHQQTTRTHKIERERNQPSRVCLVDFCRFSSIIRAPDERRWWRKQNKNPTQNIRGSICAANTHNGPHN